MWFVFAEESWYWITGPEGGLQDDDFIQSATLSAVHWGRAGSTWQEQCQDPNSWGSYSGHSAGKCRCDRRFWGEMPLLQEHVWQGQNSRRGCITSIKKVPGCVYAESFKTHYHFLRGNWEDSCIKNSQELATFWLSYPAQLLSRPQYYLNSKASFPSDTTGHFSSPKLFLTQPVTEPETWLVA